ncbi:RNA polymerase sigma factor SigJ [Phytomonospora sp. NPDC050363]|uniref:RNA polymerase sigma factor SigJ n=1 Tax=Phytomonospora sp. NPDC050363 TaxID=3155642 RepID=UPI0033DAF4FC
MTTTTLDAEAWRAHRSAVFGVAYRLLGTVSDAEDVVQDTWLRAAGADLTEVRDLRAWLITVAARRSYDVLTSARARRESYVGPWLPEPLLTGPDAAEPVIVDDSISTTMLLALENLTPEERLTTVLNGVFDVPYTEIGEMIGKSAAATRQLASRARKRMAEVTEVHDEHSTAERERILRAFKAAYEEGDLARLIGLLHPDAVYTTDGGGKVNAARKTIVGADKVARVLLGIAAKLGDAYRDVEFNGRPNLLGYRGEDLTSADAFTITEGRITRIDRVLNPDKLSHLP